MTELVPSDFPVLASDDLLRMLVAAARALHGASLRLSAVGVMKQPDPQPGDLVVELSHRSASGFHDPDAIGWLIGHDDAPYGEGDPLDGSAPMREVWDIVPLSGRGVEHPTGVHRWENASFAVVPHELWERQLPQLAAAV